MDTRFLEQRRRGWYAVRDVPAKLVPIVGRKRLRVTLRTRELRVAQHRRWAALEELNRRITAAAAQTSHDALLTEALEIRRTLADPTVLGRSGDADQGDLEELTAVDFTEEIVGDFTRDARRRGHPDPHMLSRVALGEADPD